MRTQNPLVATPCGFKSHRRHHVGMDYAPFKKPSRLAGLFSYRSVIPPFPHKTLLCKLSWGPRPTGQGGERYQFHHANSRRRKLCIACGDFLVKVTGALTSLRLLLPAKLCYANFRRGPGRPVGRQRTALHSKSPAVWLGFSHTAPSFLLLPTKLCFANFRRGPGRPVGRQTCKLCIACGVFFCRKSSRAHSAAPRFPALPGGNALRSIQKVRPPGRAFFVVLLSKQHALGRPRLPR